MIIENPDNLTEIIIQSILKLKQRAIILNFWEGISKKITPYSGKKKIK